MGVNSSYMPSDILSRETEHLCVMVQCAVRMAFPLSMVNIPLVAFTSHATFKQIPPALKGNMDKDHQECKAATVLLQLPYNIWRHKLVGLVMFSEKAQPTAPCLITGSKVQG